MEQGPGHIDLSRITAAVSLLASIVEGSDDAIIAKDIAGRIISWNPAAERMFGYAEHDVIGQHIRILIPEDHRGEDEDVFARILAGDRVAHYQTQRLTRAGDRIEVAVTVSALRDGDGTVVGASKILRDISAWHASARLQTQLAAIVESSDDAIISKDLTGTITSWNPAAERMFGYRDHEAIGQHISMLFPDTRKGSERDILGEILAGRKVDHYETRRVTRDGRILDVSLSVSPLRDLGGKIVGASKIARDVTEQKRLAARDRHASELAALNERLAAADRAKDEFLAMSNHELRTPLTAIAGFTSTMLDLGDRLDPAQQREFLEIIDTQAQRLTRLVDDLLTIGRAQMQGAGVRLQDIELRSALGRMLSTHGHDDVTVHGTLDRPVRADPHHLEQMILNYIDNARKYGADPIEVHVDIDRETATIAVEDDGRGVPIELFGRLFDPFSRATCDAEAGIPGTGLGLSIVRSLARAQGGEAWYEPRTGGGSRFCLRLGLGEASARTASSPVPHASGRRAASR